MPPLVTVITAVKDAEKFISTTVESILAQEFTNWEYIIVNDGSSDGTSEALAKFRDPRIRIISLDDPMGPAAARNIAIRQSRGEFIANLDGDDISLPHRLETQANFLMKYQNCGACGSMARIFGEKNSIRIFPTSDSRIRAEMLFTNPFVHSNVMFRKVAVMGLDEAYENRFLGAEDYALWISISRNWSLRNIPQVLGLYRTHPDQYSKNNETQTTEIFQSLSNEFLLNNGLALPSRGRINSFWFFKETWRGKSRSIARSDLMVGWLRWLLRTNRLRILKLADSLPVARSIINRGQRLKFQRQ